jgi:hypothetical protein
VAALKKAGVSDLPVIHTSVEKAIALLQKSQPEFVKVSGCTSCHHQSLPQMAMSLARQRGIPINEKMAVEQVKTVMAMFIPMRDEMLKGTEKLPDPAVTVSYALIGLAAEGQPPNPTTDAMAHLVGLQQESDGSFQPFPSRPPLEYSAFSATALSIRALQLYGKQPHDQVARAAEWLRQANPETTEDRVMQLLGLTWARADEGELRRLGSRLLGEQRPDGGWAQLPAVESDAYATGQALVALHWAGQLPVSDPAYQRGIAFLLRTQFSDGSWLVRTRAFPFQPYRESGFPHGKHQWISAAGTSWAVMALSLALPVLHPQISAVF